MCIRMGWRQPNILDMYKLKSRNVAKKKNVHTSLTSFPNYAEVFGKMRTQSNNNEQHRIIKNYNSA